LLEWLSIHLLIKLCCVCELTPHPFNDQTHNICNLGKSVRVDTLKNRYSLMSSGFFIIGLSLT